ncbi:Lsr2 family DNA-binding protein [Streptomyces sp. NBC_00557]|uniref:Lsr2 family DNA-binding protein n=1 Tax=Streptomyces sp. NBC_00557 TaxID=2975776 RepID=UPI002E7FBB0D|nr:hypothetical protein [Streptomyces sp. NBC_00557]WUC35740.1 Lsr2 family protein [Streptomyces sp. NBC_00557]
MIENLHSLLLDINGDEVLERPFTWPVGGVRTTIKAAVHSLGSCGLIAKKGDTLHLTNEARIFLDLKDSNYLIATFHANVRFVGEMLREIGPGKSHTDLNVAAATSYGLKWNTLDQVRRRSSWFRAAGLAELWSHNQVVLTDLGNSLCTKLHLAQTNEIPGFSNIYQDAPELKPAGPLVLAELGRHDQGTLATRKPQWGYLAGGCSLENIRFLTDLASPQTTKDDYVRQCVEQLAVKESSAEQTLWTLRALDLLEQIGMHTFAPTALATEWITSGNPVDLVRILHAKVTLVGEILSGLREETETGALLRWLTTNFPNHRLSRAELTRRLALLSDTELIERIGHTRYRITPLGELFHDSVPLLERKNVSSSSPHGPSREQAPDAMEDDLVVHAAEVLRSSCDSANPRSFEDAIEASFNLLGLEVERHGGPGKTDLVLTFWISPTRRCRVIVEVKTDSAGTIHENDIKFDALEDHRKKHKAERVIVVGPGFGGRLPQWAKSKCIPLVSASDIADWLSRSVHTRLFPQELFNLIFSDSAESMWTAATRSLEAISQVSDALWESGNDKNDIAFNEGALTNRDIWRMSKGSERVPLSPDEIENALDLLANPLIAASIKAKNGEYTSTAAPQLVAARLRTFANVLESGLPSATKFSVPDSRVCPPETEEPAAQNPASATLDVTPEKVRRWAKSSGRPVSSRGRLPNSLIAEYLASVVNDG